MVLLSLALSSLLASGAYELGHGVSLPPLGVPVSGGSSVSAALCLTSLTTTDLQPLVKPT